MRRAAVAAVAAGCHPSRAATANAAAAAGAPRPPHPLLAALPSLLFPIRPRNEAGAGAGGEGGGEGLSPMPGCDFFDGGGADAAPPQAAVVDTRVEWTAGGDGSWVAVHRVTELVGGGGGGGGCPFDRRPAPYDLAAHPPPFGFDREE